MASLARRARKALTRGTHFAKIAYADYTARTRRRGTTLRLTKHGFWSSLHRGQTPKVMRGSLLLPKSRRK